MYAVGATSRTDDTFRTRPVVSHHFSPTIAFLIHSLGRSSNSAIPSVSRNARAPREFTFVQRFDVMLASSNFENLLQRAAPSLARPLHRNARQEQRLPRRGQLLHNQTHPQQQYADLTSNPFISQILADVSWVSLAAFSFVSVFGRYVISFSSYYMHD